MTLLLTTYYQEKLCDHEKPDRSVAMIQFEDWALDSEYHPEGRLLSWCEFEDLD